MSASSSPRSGEEALITGDIAHHPCQLRAGRSGARPPTATRRRRMATRHAMFGGLAGKPVLVIGTHFAGPTAGRVARDGAGYRLLVCW